MDKKFSHTRFCEAQTLANISNGDLADSVGVTIDMISKWRRGIAVPRQENITQIYRHLNVPESFLYRHDKFVNLEGRILNRLEKSSVGKKKSDRLRIFSEYYTEALEKILNKFDLPDVDIPDLKFGDPLNATLDDVEDAAMELRKYWKLGLLPIRTWANLLLTKGIVVQSFNSSGWDGVSFVEGERPYILYARDKQPSRDKTTIGHELGHLVLHHLNQDCDFANLTKTQYNKLEEQAFFFFGCLAMPREAYLRDLPFASFSALKSIKPKWQTSIKSQIMHLHKLRCINDEEKVKLYKAYSWHKAGTKEPNENLITPEEGDLGTDAVKDLEKSSDTAHLDSVLNQIPNIVSYEFGRDQFIVVPFEGLKSKSWG